jgi:hypothetical protein
MRHYAKNPYSPTAILVADGELVELVGRLALQIGGSQQGLCSTECTV